MSDRTSSTRWVAWTVLLAGLSTLAAGLSVWALVSARSDQRTVDRAVTAQVADRLSTSLTAVTSSLLGVDGLAADGSVTEEEFDAFAVDIVAAGEFAALAFAEPVADSDRSAWEELTGLEIRDGDGAGGFVAAASRPDHVVVRWAAPLTDSNRSVLGFDLAGDPVRGDGVSRAATTQGVTLSGPIIGLAASAQPGVFVAIAVRDPDGTVVGYVASGVSLDATVERLAGVGDLGSFGVELGGEMLVGEPRGSSSQVTVAGREFTVYGRGDGRRSRLLLTLAFGAATVMLLAGALFAGRRQAAERRRDVTVAERARLLAQLAEELVNATTTTAVMETVADRAGPVVGARHTNVGRRVGSDPSKLQVIHDRAMGAELADRYSLQDLDADLPLPESARTGQPVVLSSPGAVAARYPHVVADVTAAGIRAICCTPLSLGGDSTVGVIGFAFDNDLDARDRADVVTTAALVGQMTGRAFERALARELVQERVDMLSEFARALTTARSSDDVASCVGAHLPRLLDVETAALSPTIPNDATLRSYRAATTGEHVVLNLRPGRAWGGIDETLAVTVVDLVGGALTRTRLSDQEQAVLQRIQESLLTPAPIVDGYDIAVAYRSALEAVGIGGDWYSIVETSDAIYAVIGDIAGHGPGAVSLMAEVKTVMRDLLTNGVSMEQAVERAHRTLTRRGAYASAAVVRIETATGDAQYINAGHLPLIHYASDRVDQLGDTHRPWLGVDAPATRPASSFQLRSGDLLLMYTDGLIEDRRQPIDTSITDRLHHIDTTDDASEIVDTLIARRIADRTATSVDDDVAAIAIKRYP